MMWLQAAVSFAIWVGWGFWFRPRSQALRSRVALQPRSVVVALVSGGFLLSGAVLLGALYGIAALGGLQDGALAPWAWVCVTLVGWLFVAMQTVAATALTHLVLPPQGPRQETGGIRQPSVQE